MLNTTDVKTRKLKSNQFFIRLFFDKVTYFCKWVWKKKRTPSYLSLNVLVPFIIIGMSRKHWQKPFAVLLITISWDFYLVFLCIFPQRKIKPQINNDILKSRTTPKNMHHDTDANRKQKWKIENSGRATAVRSETLPKLSLKLQWAVNNINNQASDDELLKVEQECLLDQWF